MLEIKKYNSITTEYQLSKKLLESLELSELLEQKNREILFIKDICKRVEKSKTVLYVLKKDNENLEKIYKKLNFNKLNKTGWMFISI